MTIGGVSSSLYFSSSLVTLIGIYSSMISYLTFSKNDTLCKLHIIPSTEQKEWMSACFLLFRKFFHFFFLIINKYTIPITTNKTNNISKYSSGARVTYVI